MASARAFGSRPGPLNTPAGNVRLWVDDETPFSQVWAFYEAVRELAEQQ